MCHLPCVCLSLYIHLFSLLSVHFTHFMLSVVQNLSVDTCHETMLLVFVVLLPCL